MRSFVSEDGLKFGIRQPDRSNGSVSITATHALCSFGFFMLFLQLGLNVLFNRGVYLSLLEFGRILSVLTRSPKHEDGDGSNRTKNRPRNVFDHMRRIIATISAINC